MKELSIEQKAKAYDEALIVAKQWYNDSNTTKKEKYLLKGMFSELVESEDEMIRKELITHCRNTRCVTEEGAERIAKRIAWLEKQGNLMKALQFANKTIGELTDENYHLREKLNEQKPAEWSEEDERIRKELIEFVKSRGGFKQEYIAWLEKQGEQKPIDPDTLIQQRVDALADIVAEQKPTDKVEPKFKVGDEIKTKNEESFTITRIDRWGYWSEDLFICNFDDTDKWELVEQKADETVKWSSQEESCICQLESLVKEQWRQAERVHNSVNIKKMSELMFFLKTLNPNKKPANKVEPKFKIGDWVVRGKTIAQILDIQEQYYVGLDIDGNDFTSSRFLSDDKIHLWTIQDAKDGDVLATEPIEGYHSPFVAIYKKQNEEDFNSYCFIGFDGKFYKGENGHSTEEIHPATKEQSELLFAKMKEAGYEWDAEKKELKKIEQNPAWSEEDEEQFSFCCAAIEMSNYSSDEYRNYAISFLESLKDRILPQPKQEWSEEVESAIQLLEDIADEQEKDSCPYNANDLRIASQYLKSLRPQNRWKPSEEQMETLHAVSQSIRKHGDPDSMDDYRNLTELYNELVKLM